MKRFASVCVVIFFFSLSCLAQSVDDSPASKADVERYFQIVDSHNMLTKLMGAESKTMHQLVHDQYLKHKDELPSDYESKINALMDDMYKDIPFDEMLQAMVPAFQKHLSKGDIDSLVAFYSSPTGEKVLREMPDMMAEAMQDMMPIMNKWVDTIQDRVRRETDTMIAQSKKGPTTNSPNSN